MALEIIQHWTGSHGCEVLLHGRDLEKGRKTQEKIAQETGNDQLELFVADLSSQKQ